MDIDEIPGEATLRQRMDKHAISFLPIVEKAGRDFLSNIQPALRPLSTGHIPVDADVTPMDNSGSHKEGVSRTSRDMMGTRPWRFTWAWKATVSALNFEKASSTYHIVSNGRALPMRKQALVLLCLIVPSTILGATIYAKGDYNGDLIHLGVRDLNPRHSRFTTPDPRRQFMSGYIYSASSPVTYSDPTGAMMEGEAVEAVVSSLDSAEPVTTTTVAKESVRPVAPPRVAPVSSQTESLMSYDIVTRRNIVRLRDAVYCYHETVPLLDQASADLDAAHTEVTRLKRYYETKRKSLYYWTNTLKVQSLEVPREAREQVLRQAIQEYGIAPETEYQLRNVMQAPLIPTPPTHSMEMPQEFLRSPEPPIPEIPKQPQENPVQRHTLRPETSETALDLSAHTQQSSSPFDSFGQYFPY